MTLLPQHQENWSRRAKESSAHNHRHGDKDSPPHQDTTASPNKMEPELAEQDVLVRTCRHFVRTSRSKPELVEQLSQADLARVQLGSLAGEDWRMRQAFADLRAYPLQPVTDLDVAVAQSQSFEAFQGLVDKVGGEKVEIFLFGEMRDIETARAQVEAFLNIPVVLQEPGKLRGVDLKGFRSKCVDGAALLRAANAAAAAAPLAPRSCTIVLSSYEILGARPGITQELENDERNNKNKKLIGTFDATVRRSCRGLGAQNLFDRRHRTAILSAAASSGKRMDRAEMSLKPGLLSILLSREILFQLGLTLCFLNKCTLNGTSVDDYYVERLYAQRCVNRNAKTLDKLTLSNLNTGVGEALHCGAVVNEGYQTGRLRLQEILDQPAPALADHLRELEGFGLRLCPVCTRKLIHITKEDPLNRLLAQRDSLAELFPVDSHFFAERAKDAGCAT
ncbi:unnamed protein product [Amoebophrya sp. A25]|nr:unnamed protein product [Amoebophrya sp. A25]|eukprot:GSA25T00027238001.1